jgi:hypothetical protein
MPRTSKSGSLKTIATQRADDYKWGIPESPEFSAAPGMHPAHTDLNGFQSAAVYGDLGNDTCL